MIRRFTAADDETIIAAFRRGDTLTTIAAQLGRPTVQHRVQKLMREGRLAYGNRTRRPWTEHDLQELRGSWGWLSQPKIARRLGRSLNAVQVRAQRLGLSDRWRGAFTACDVGKLFAVDAKTVRIWIGHGWLVGSRSDVKCGSTRKWRIEHEAVEAFIASYPMHYGRQRIREPYWRELADKAADRFDMVSLRVAARIIGCADETIKRRIRRGLWHGEQVPWAGGFAWMVRRADLATFRYLKPPTPMIYAKGHVGAIRKAAVR